MQSNLGKILRLNDDGSIPADNPSLPGVGVTEIAMQLLEKVEELTLHAIEQDKRIAELERKLKQ